MSPVTKAVRNVGLGTPAFRARKISRNKALNRPKCRGIYRGIRYLSEISANIPRLRHKFLLKNGVFKADALAAVRPSTSKVESSLAMPR